MSHLQNHSQRIPSLDGLRAVSILLVVFSHLWFTRSPIAAYFDLGTLGVKVFFVISGFLITSLLLNELSHKGNINLKKFYFRRMFRIFPPYYFFLLITLLLGLAGMIEYSLGGFLAAALYITDYSNNLWYLGHTWSLSVEEQFYLLWPFILVYAGKKWALVLIVCIVVAAPFGRLLVYHFVSKEWFVLQGGFHGNIDILAAGCLLAFVRGRLHESRIYRQVLGAQPLIYLPFLILIINTLHAHPKIYFIGLTAMNLLIAFCIDAAVTHPEQFAGRLLNTPVLVFIGVMSYSIYLWQELFVKIDEVPLAFDWMVVRVALIATTSLFSYFIIEKPSLKLRQRFEKRLFGSHNITASTKK